MDVLLRLRVLIWALVLSLWGIMVYQYLGEEESEARQMQFVANPYKGIAPPEPTAEQLAAANAELLRAKAEAAAAVAAAAAAPPQVDPIPPQEVAMANSPGAALAPGGPSSLDFIKQLPAPPPQQRPRAPRPQPRPPIRHERGPRAAPDPPVPPGFVKTVTRHFSIYAEGAEASQEFVKILESLHGNLMLDLAAFSPWAADQRVSIFLFKNQDTYRQVTGRPAWSGGASSVAKRKVYVYESEELPGILAHELCHIYFDGFFIDGVNNPLWLSEGMATLIQVERGMAAPNWLRENMEILEGGGGYPISEMMSITTTSGAGDDKVRLWYAQSYSVVRFLIRSQYRSSFYKFSEYLREGKDVQQALYRAYGMPYNRLKALEYAWRYELTSNQISKLSSANP